MDVERTYLYVPPEEKGEVEASGAQWDGESKCWYIGADADPGRFSKWLPSEEGEEELEITSDRAYVASAETACWKCRKKIDVICIYCERGEVSGEELEEFTVSGIGAMDDALTRQLAGWPFFKRVEREGDYANHCRHCGAVQDDDVHLHSEPEHPFFSIPRAAPGEIELTPLVGRVRLSGNESFEA